MKTTLKIVLTGHGHQSSGMYVAGSTISGYLLINTSKNLLIKNLKLTFTGKEVAFCRWETSYSTYETCRKFSIAEVVVPILDLPDLIDGGKVLLPGEFKIPFAFNLPRNLPTCFKETLVENGVLSKFEPDYCQIIYSMEAVLEEMGYCLTGLLKLKAHKDIKVSAKPVMISKTNTPYHLLEPFSIKIPQFMCFCKTNGSLTFGAKLLPSEHLKRLQRMELQMAMINDTAMTVQKIELHLQQKVIWSNDRVLKKSKNRTISSRIASFEKKKSSSSSSRRRSSLSLMSLSSSNKKKEDAVREVLLFSGGSAAASDDTFDIRYYSAHFSPISPMVLDSYQGKYIEIKHGLEVIIDTGCGKWNPKFEIPIKIIPGGYGTMTSVDNR